MVIVFICVGSGQCCKAIHDSVDIINFKFYCKKFANYFDC